MRACACDSLLDQDEALYTIGGINLTTEQPSRAGGNLQMMFCAVFGKLD